MNLNRENCINDPSKELECILNLETETVLSNQLLFMWTNRKRLNLQDYSSPSPIIKESFLQFMSIPRQARTSIYYVRLAELVREDNLLMALDGITDKDDTFFSISHRKDLDRVSSRNFFSRVEIVLGLDDEVTLIERNVYNTFMLLGDVGGFSGLLYASGAVLIRIFNFANAENFVVQSLYARELDDDGNKASEGLTRELDPGKQLALKEWMQALLPSKCLCLCFKKRRRDHDFQIARAKL